MDPCLLSSFQAVVSKLVSTTDGASGLPQNEELGYIFTLIKDKISLDRLCRLQDIINVNYPILLGHKSISFWQTKETEPVDKSISFVTFRKGSKRSSANSERSNNVTGSPLKLDIIADLSIIEGEDEVLVSKSKLLDCGLPIGKTRKLLSVFCNSFNKKTPDGEIPNLVVLCDGANLQGVACMSVVPLIDKQNNFMGFKMSQLSCKPAAEKSKLPKSVPDFANKEVNCYAKYDIISNLADKLNPDFQSSLYLELQWTKRAGQLVVLLHDPPTDATANVKVQVMSGYTSSPMFSLYQELEILRSIITGIATTELNWIGMQEKPLVETTRDLIEQLKLGNDVIESSVVDISGEGAVSSLESVLLEERKDLDFTDHLWKVLHNCTSYAELVETFEYIVKVLREGELQPFIHKDNNTTIAQMVKDSYRGQLRTPQLTGLSPLTYLAEIGIQKLTHDYIYVFLSKNLSNRMQLEYFIKANLELEDRLERLSKLQNTLEVIITQKQALNLPQSTLGDSTRQILKHYEESAIENAHHFLLPVPTSALSGVLEIYPPCEWRAESRKMVGSTPERTVYHLSVDQLIDWVDLPTGTVGSSGDAGEMSYYLTQLKDSVSILY